MLKFASVPIVKILNVLNKRRFLGSLGFVFKLKLSTSRVYSTSSIQHHYYVVFVNWVLCVLFIVGTSCFELVLPDLVFRNSIEHLVTLIVNYLKFFLTLGLQSPLCADALSKDNMRLRYLSLSGNTQVKSLLSLNAVIYERLDALDTFDNWTSCHANDLLPSIGIYTEGRGQAGKPKESGLFSFFCRLSMQTTT